MLIETVNKAMKDVWKKTLFLSPSLKVKQYLFKIQYMFIVKEVPELIEVFKDLTAVYTLGNYTFNIELKSELIKHKDKFSSHDWFIDMYNAGTIHNPYCVLIIKCLDNHAFDMFKESKYSQMYDNKFLFNYSTKTGLSKIRATTDVGVLLAEKTLRVFVKDETLKTFISEELGVKKELLEELDSKYESTTEA